MAGGENQIPIRNKASRKRPNQGADENSMTKKRAVLGEITNISSNALESTPNSCVVKSRRPKPESILDKPGNEVSHELAVSPGSDESQKHGYAPSMLQYLRSLEVFCPFFYVKFLDGVLAYDVSFF